MSEPRQGIGKYFIAIVPPSPVFDRVEAWKQKFGTELNTRAALRSPAHITLHMPFEWKDKKRTALMEGLSAFAATQTSFVLRLANFGAFPPRVIFIDVVPNESLSQLQHNLSRFCRQQYQLFNANRQDLPFHPHLTVAFRDLKKKDFAHAWAMVEHEPFVAEFQVSELALLQHDGKLWRLAEKFGLSP